MKNKKDYQIGEIFVHDGKQYKVSHVKEYKSCKGCAFVGKNNMCTLDAKNDDVPECMGVSRSDGLNVIFKPVKTNTNEFSGYEAVENIAENMAISVYPQDALDSIPRQALKETIRKAYAMGFVDGWRVRDVIDK